MPDMWSRAMTGSEIRTMVAIGFVGGVMSGLLGIGGGVVMIPPLVLIAKMRQHDAHAASLVSVVPIATVGALRFASAGEVDLILGLALAGGAVIGAPVGARMMSGASEAALKTAFGALLAMVGIVLIWP